jgi:hypothetical protein
MRRTQLSLACSLPLALAACGSVVSEDSPEAVELAVGSSYGGETAADEAPAFGDQRLAAPEFQVEDAPVTDTTTVRPELDGARHVQIAVVWGYPRPTPDFTSRVDWSGTISVTNAGLRVLRVLRFEDTDVVVRPRTDLHTVAFESVTGPHADGLLLDVVIAPSLNPEGGPVVLRFDTAPYTGSLTIEPGMRLSHVQPVDDAGHVVAYHVIAPDGPGCTEGFFRGRWQTVADLEGGRLGVLRGRFTAHDGRIRGHLRGVFGVRENGHQVWFAKVIDRDGKFLGLVAGRWGEGKLAGLFLTNNDADERIVKGVLRGVYFEAGEDREGGFFGRYSERCGEDRREGTASPSDEPAVELDGA